MAPQDELVRRQAELLVQRELDLTALRLRHDRTLSWWSAYRRHESGLTARISPRAAYELWIGVLCEELDFQVVAVYAVEQEGLELLSRQPALDGSLKPAFDPALWTEVQSHPVGFVNEGDRTMPRLAAQLQLARFLWCTVSSGERSKLLVVAGFDARVARYRNHLDAEDAANFQWVARQLETRLQSLALIQQLDAQRQELEHTLATVNQQAATIRQLSMPVLDLWEDILVVPIIGELDATRGEMITRGVLDRLTETRAKSVIIDVTGIETVDTKSADYLLKLSRAVSLLGARCVVTGLRSSVAVTLVGLGADLSALCTFRDLRAGLKACMSQLGS